MSLKSLNRQIVAEAMVSFGAFQCLSPLRRWLEATNLLVKPFRLSWFEFANRSEPIRMKGQSHTEPLGMYFDSELICMLLGLMQYGGVSLT